MNPSSSSSGYHSRAAAFASPHPRGGGRQRGGGGRGDGGDRIDALGRLLSAIFSGGRAVRVDIVRSAMSDKLIAGAFESAAAIARQGLYAPFSKELPDAASSEELITASPQTVPHSTILRSLPPRNCYSASSGPTIWERKPKDWYFTFFIRMDRANSFHMYPDLGGTFQSIQEAEDAIDRHLDELQRRAKHNEQDEDRLERVIRHSVFHPDGTPKRGPNSPSVKNPNYVQRDMVRAVLDQYKDDHDLSGDLALELKDDVSFEYIHEESKSYCHLNFMTKTKEVGGTNNLFFVELSQMLYEDDWVISCCCMIEPNEKGCCLGCIHNESPYIKHPNNDLFSGGHEENFETYGVDPVSNSDDDEDAQVAKLRIRFRGLSGGVTPVGC